MNLMVIPPAGAPPAIWLPGKTTNHGRDRGSQRLQGGIVDNSAIGAGRTAVVPAGADGGIQVRATDATDRGVIFRYTVGSRKECHPR